MFIPKYYDEKTKKLTTIKKKMFRFWRTVGADIMCVKLKNEGPFLGILNTHAWSSTHFLLIGTISGGIFMKE